MSYRLDDLARRLATRELVTRRRALGVMGGTVAGFALAAGAPRRAYATDDCPDPDNPVQCGDPFGNGACCPTDYTCCEGANGLYTCVAPDGSFCCGDAAATQCVPGWSCLADGSNGLGGCCETSNGSTVCGGIYCCLPSEFCVDGACSDCPADQICGSDCCAQGVSCIDGACCNSLVVCAGKCCVSGGKCIDGQCCDNELVCGSICCPSDQPYCLDGQCCSAERQCGSTCCAPNQACCQMSDGSATCCPDGNSCVREILPGNIGITPDSPNICCPPERLVTATATPICCPPGSVHQPGGGVSTNGGLCCTEANVCGQHCCDSLPSFPMKCVNGGCVFDLAKINQQNAQAANNDNVNLQLTTTGSASGQLTVETPAAGASALGLVAAAKPQVLGSTKFRLKGGGHHTVKIRLNARGRRLLKHQAKLHAEAVITFTKDGKSVSSTSSLTIVAPHRR